MMVAPSFNDYLFLQAGADIDRILTDQIIASMPEIGTAGVIDIYRKLAVSMVFNTASVIMASAKDEAEGRRLVAEMASLFPVRVSEGLERAIALGIQARPSNFNRNQG